ncbi:MAG: pentapeptide repeat-containing protein [Bacteriovoracia bacterium]
MIKSAAVVGLIYAWVVGYAMAGDLGYRYRDGKCQNANGQPGLNPSYLGQCSDLRGVVLGRLNLNGIDFSGSQFIGADLQKSTFAQANLTATNFETAILSGIELDGTKLDRASFKGAVLKNVKLIDMHFVNNDFTGADFRGTDLTDVVATDSIFNKTNFSGAKLDGASFTGCKLEEANLSSATGAQAKFIDSGLTQASFTGAMFRQGVFSRSTLERADLTGAVLERADLRGVSFKGAKLRRVRAGGAALDNAMMDGADLHAADFRDSTLAKAKLAAAIFTKRSLLPLTTEEAQAAGMVLKRVQAVLLVLDVLNGTQTAAFAQYLTQGNDDIELTLTAVQETQFVGVGIADADVVIHFNGGTSGTDMPVAGQEAIVNFVKAGGRFIHGEWNAFELKNGRMAKMTDVTLFSSDSTSGTRQVTLTAFDGQDKHPLAAGLTAPIRFSIGGNLGPVRNFAENPVLPILKDDKGMPAVAMRKFEKGEVIGFYFNAGGNSPFLADANIRRLYLNAIRY